MLGIEIDGLICTSVIEQVRDSTSPLSRLELGRGTPPIEIYRVPDVLYFPNFLQEGQSLQIVNRRILPLEAVLYDYMADFVKARVSPDHREDYSTGVDVREIAGDVCILGNVFSRNFTHWHEELFKVVMLEKAGLRCSYAFAGLPPFARGLLELVGIDNRRIIDIEKATVFRSVLYATPVNYYNLSDHPGVLDLLREALFAVDISAEPAVSSRLWFHREAQARLGRKLVNTDDVYECLKRYDVQPIDFGALSLRGQIAAARGAELMSGTHGSHFVHSQLMRSRSGVIECFSPLYLNPTYTDIYRVMRHRYSQITGTNTPVFPYPHGMDVEVDCAQLKLALEEMSKR
jgi:glycosyl transferase family 61